jgi:hypothetical protein
MAMLEMGIPKHKAEVALTETGNMGVEVATEWLFSAPESAQIEQYTTSDTGKSPSTVQHSAAREGAQWQLQWLSIPVGPSPSGSQWRPGGHIAVRDSSLLALTLLLPPHLLLLLLVVTRGVMAVRCFLSHLQAPPAAQAARAA